jgi:hypothetical protein
MIFTSILVVTLLVMSGIAVLAAVALFRRPPRNRPIEIRTLVYSDLSPNPMVPPDAQVEAHWLTW